MLLLSEAERGSREERRWEGWRGGGERGGKRKRIRMRYKDKKAKKKHGQEENRGKAETVSTFSGQLRP